ncbi:OmpA family protein [Flavobacterium sp. ANB]|uniref:OmpA family protein n=1 Tax=unclassified Flavobacterium TaxID=196869 RepID=UPI0012B9A1E5|nr:MULTISPECIES: OmpA family protein [unclassified Flavobacterium]MBF4519559.1 OmpA family protein [Flavobacterium sp. ANB]MTD72558.1 OmpA family protein [Flavobacterium sp. LC2016-13]
MEIKKLLYTAFLSSVCFNGMAQKTVLNKADKAYNQYAYVDAISIYEKVAERGYKDEKTFQRLGNAYYFNAELTKALKWYDALFALNNEQEPEYYYRYAQALKSVGDYAKSDKMLDVFNQKVKTDSRGVLFQNNKNYLEQIKVNSGRFDISDSGINSNQSDYGSTIFNNKLVFASARDSGTVSRKTFRWTNKSFTNLYASELKSDGSLEDPIRFDKKINSKFNESTPVFTKDGKTMYFTRNNFLHGKKGKDDKSITLLKLYKADFVNDKWTNVTELPFNSNAFSVAHPALSTDEKKLYFASDMPGSLGQSDLYSVAIHEDGTFGKPENLGSAINTEGRETFPFISGDNELYFASDGRPGLGGLDVFTAKIKEDSGFESVQNIGEPVNTKFDDFAFIIDNSTRKGFFSSNKEGGKGNDDIYKFTETRKLDCEKKLAGTITDAETNAVLSEAKVILLDDKFQQIAEVTSTADGNYSFDVKCNKNYHVRAVKKEYETNESAIAIQPSTDKEELNIKLEKQIKPITIGTDLAKTLNIPIIYFDLDKAFIRKDASFELEKVLAVLKEYPEMKIDVRSHTDSRQTAKYNIVLSNKRVKATIEWFVKKGISANRLTGRGYGETQLVNKCSDDVLCTEEEHQLNRRSEFIIVSIK